MRLLKFSALLVAILGASFTSGCTTQETTYHITNDRGVLILSTNSQSNVHLTQIENGQGVQIQFKPEEDK